MIVVFGSLNLDMVVSVSRIPVPGETILGDSYRQAPGGKGANQALAAARSGAATRFVGARGKDPNGIEAASALQAAGVDLSGLVESDTPTGVAFIVVDGKGENSIAVAPGANREVTATQLEEVYAPAGTLLLLQQEIDAKANVEAATFGKRRGWRILFNAAPASQVPDALLDMIDCLIVNEHEARHMAAAEFGDCQAREAGRKLSEKHRCQVVVTLGAAGVVSFSEHCVIDVSAPRVEVVDTTGAGDTFVGAFAAALDSGLGSEEALRFGAFGGSLACTRAGAQTSIPTAAEIHELLGRGLTQPIELARQRGR